ncbi:TonB-dependent receptor [Flavisphingomonas formosensis]|uniref:TonB-dependent receptor n=1 Tax=Flavisphingomonas formosensis TaxID=861534 RepID=UPI0012F896E6|nr:TonB-dependent receptor [Sphingomonas formosensis]
MLSTVARLLGATALALVPAYAYAQSDAPVQLAAADASDAGAQNEIVVLGFGQARQVQTLAAKDIAVLTPGSSPLKAISKLPGVNFQSADAFGAYEWSTRITLRGFNQNQLGFTLDGVPLGDMSYGNYNGLHISRAIISENLGAVTVAQGAGSLGTASTSNLGGTLQFSSRKPGDHFDVAAGGTYGSDDTIRGYVRLDTGDLTGHGLKGYLSYSYLGTDKWKGDGKQRQHQVNAKLVQELDRGSITAWFNFSDRRENDYQDMSKAMIARLGYNWDNISDDWALAKRIAHIAANRGDVASYPDPSLGTTYPGAIETVDDAYFNAAGLRKDYIGAVTFESHLTDAVSAKLTGYAHHNEGQGIWFTPYVPTLPGAQNQDGSVITNPAPISVRTTEYDITRGGAIASVAVETGRNRLEVGGWYESNSFRNARRFYGLTDADTVSRDSLEFQKNPFATQWDIKYDTETIQYFVQDRLDLGRVTLTGGWKGYKVTNSANPIVSGGLATGRIDATDWFLPQVGGVFHVTDDAELFATFTQNMRAFVSAATGGPFSTTQAGFDNIKNTLKPERSDTYEFGGRFRAGGFQASIAGYYVNFTNRLLAFQNGAGILGNPAVLQNVGGVHSYGAELSLLYKLNSVLSLLGTYSYNHSTYQDDVIDKSGKLIAATKGKTTVDSPRNMATAEISYDDGHIMGRIGANYMSKRFYTYENDQSVGGRVLVDASIGYRFTDVGPIGDFSIEGSVTNLTDKRYISTIGSNGFGARGDAQTLLPGAPRQWFVTVRKGF